MIIIYKVPTYNKLTKVLLRREPNFAKLEDDKKTIKL